MCNKSTVAPGLQDFTGRKSVRKSQPEIEGKATDFVSTSGWDGPETLRFHSDLGPKTTG